MLAYVLLFLGLASAFAALLAYSRARSVLSSPGDKAHSRPVYHALNAAIWTGIPAFVMLIVWLFLHDNIIDAFVLAKVPGADLLEPAQRSLLLSEIRQTAAGNAFVEIRPEVAAGAEHYKTLISIANAVLVVAAASLAVCSVSLFSAPGSPVLTRRSISPGASTLPRASIFTSAGVALLTPEPTSMITPFSISTPPFSSSPLAGSMTRAL